MALHLKIDTAERRVSLDGADVAMRAKCFDLLSLLASRPGHLFTKDALMARIWEGRAVSPDVLTGCIREIRKALGEEGRHCIETVPGSGLPPLLHGRRGLRRGRRVV